MPKEVRGDERAPDRHRQPALPDVIECAGRKTAADPASLERLVDLGVEEDQPTAADETVFGEPNDAPAEVRLVALLGGIIDEREVIRGGRHDAIVRQRDAAAPG
jgi:hypothetical protein